MKKYKKTAVSVLLLLVFMAVVIFIYQKQAGENEQNNAQVLTDGEYTPDDFTWSGGSGKVSISCEKIKVEQGQAYAQIIFTSPYYSTVTIKEKTYEGTYTKDASTFTIPVILNETNKILAVTTRMSTAHEIEYEIAPYLAAAGEKKENTKKEEESQIVQTATADISHEPLEIQGLTYESRMELSYAKGFDVFYYQDGYALINVYDSAQYLVVPEGKDVPQGMDSQIKVLQKPLNHIYLAATSVMSLFRAVDALEDIRFTGTKASGWYIEEAKEALEKKTMLFAGKYSEPDYELLVNEGCNLAIESTMILHAPKVQEMIESLKIPVFIDRSSYETHPLGRTEWIKLYGVFADKEEAARKFFDQQAEVINQLKDFENTKKTVAFFYMDTKKTVVVRKSEDYIPSMIEIAGGQYIFSDLENDTGNSASVALSMEEFYAKAREADYLIYNGTIDNPLNSIEELLEKNELFGEFKAVKEGNVWTIGKDLYQSTDIVGQLIYDVNQMLTGSTAKPMTFLEKVK